MSAPYSRLRAELKAYKKSHPKPDESYEIIIDVKNDNLMRWKCFIKGPDDSPYAGRYFELRVHIGSSYPMTPPKIFFVTKVFHPNVKFSSGEICLDILQSTWSPVWTIESLCRALILLLSHPEPSSPLNCDAGNLMRAKDKIGFHSIGKMYTMEMGLKFEDLKA